MPIIPLALPPGWAAYGASEADPVLSYGGPTTDGPTFWGMDTVYNGEWFGYAVFRQVTAGVPATKVAELPDAGQGRLSAQGDGKLYASAYPKTGNSTTTAVAEVPGFVPFPAPAGARGPVGPPGPPGPAGPAATPDPRLKGFLDGLGQAIKALLGLK